ncbi:MAG: hypothetical protein AAGA53_12575 [Pseudomonadota bacterium]
MLRSIGEVPSSAINEEQLTLIAAPRSSLGYQNQILAEISTSLNVQSGWMLNAGDRVLCLTRQGEVKGSSLPEPGALTPMGDTVIANGLMMARGVVREEANGYQSMLMIVENRRGIGLGSIAVVAPPGQALDEERVNLETKNALSVFEDGQLQLRPANQEEQAGR